MNSDRWGQIEELFHQAADLAPADRAAFLQHACNGDEELQREVESLLESDASGDTFLKAAVARQERLLDQGSLSDPAQPSLAGQPLGPYKVLSLIGEGGMGSVWLAERSDGRFERRAAVKVLRAPLVSGGGAERFKREGAILARLAHPHIAQLLDAGVSPAGQPYLILEHVEGEDIVAHCDRRRLDVEARLRLFLDVLAAVAHAHANLIIHRDLKPSNVLVRTDGQVKLLDFGIAKLLEDEGTVATTQLTREGGGGLTPFYAAPEQLTGGRVTTATDVYAAGVLLYLLLTGRHPAGPGPHSTAELVKAIVDTQPPSLSDAIAPPGGEFAAAAAVSRSTTPPKLHHALRGDLDTIVAKALKKNPQDRYASVTALGDDLRRYLRHEPISARPDTLAYRATKFVRRNRTPTAFAMLAFFAVVAGLVAAISQAHKARVERDFAYREVSRAEQMNDLNAFLLTDAAPSDKPLNVDDLLEREEAIVERENYRNHAPNHVQLLISIGSQYFEKDKNAKALRVLEEGYQTSRKLADPSARARAACALALPVQRDGQQTRAESLVQEGLRELPNDVQFALDRVFCLLRGSEVGISSGAVQEAIVRAKAAQRLLKDSPLQSDNLKLRVLLDLADAYNLAGRNGEAIAAFEQASAQLTNLGYDQTKTAASLFGSWGLALDFAGRPREAEKIYRRGIDATEAEGPRGAPPPMLLKNYGAVLHELGRLSEAADYVERAYKRAKEANDQVVIEQSLLERTRIYRDQGDLARASAMLAEVEPLLRRDLPPAHYAFASLTLEQALLAHAKGDLPAASRLADQAVAGYEAAIKAGALGPYAIARSLISRSGIELEARQPDRAVADAIRVVNLSANVKGSPTLGPAYLALGRALEAQGKYREARAAFRSAAECLQATLGSDHPDTRTALKLAGLPHAAQ